MARFAISSDDSANTRVPARSMTVERVMTPLASTHRYGVGVPDFTPEGYGRDALGLPASAPPNDGMLSIKREPQGELVNRMGTTGALVYDQAHDEHPIVPPGKLTEGVSIAQPAKNRFGQHNPGRPKIP